MTQFIGFITLAALGIYSLGFLVAFVGSCLMSWSSGEKTTWKERLLYALKWPVVFG